jgi:hypothetical protein
VITMPRSAQEILDHAAELAARFEQHEPGDDLKDAMELRDVRDAVESVSGLRRLACSRHCDGVTASPGQGDAVGGACSRLETRRSDRARCRASCCRGARRDDPDRRERPSQCRRFSGDGCRWRRHGRRPRTRTRRRRALPR